MRKLSAPQSSSKVPGSVISPRIIDEGCLAAKWLSRRSLIRSALTCVDMWCVIDDHISFLLSNSWMTFVAFETAPASLYTIVSSPQSEVIYKSQRPDPHVTTSDYNSELIYLYSTIRSTYVDVLVDGQTDHQVFGSAEERPRRCIINNGPGTYVH